MYRAQIAQTASFGADLRVDTGLLIAYAIAASGATPDQLARALRHEIELLAQKPVPPAELAKIKTQLVTQALIDRQTPLGKAMALGEAAVTLGDVRRVNEELAELQAVTAADVQRVVRQVPDRRAGGHDRVHPGGQAMSRACIAGSWRCSRWRPPRTLHAQALDTPPPIAAPRPLDIAPPAVATLPNGLRVVVAQRRGLPLVTAELLVRSGAETDPPTLAGLANLTGTLLAKGTATRSAPAIAEAAEALGGALDSGAGWDRSYVTITVARPHVGGRARPRRRRDAASALRERRARARATAGDRRPERRARAARDARAGGGGSRGVRREHLRPRGRRYARLARAHSARRRRGAARASSSVRTTRR